MTTERAAVRGAFLGVVVFFPGVVGMTLLAGGGTSGALALAAYCSFFGGMGFGAMVGSVIHLARAEEAEEAAHEHRTAAAPERGPGSADPAVPIDVAA
jgi:hypothetical protein